MASIKRRCAPGTLLRVEFFNLFNHPNFALPDHNLTSGYDQFGGLQCDPKRRLPARCYHVDSRPTYAKPPQASEEAGQARSSQR